MNDFLKYYCYFKENEVDLKKYYFNITNFISVKKEKMCLVLLNWARIILILS